MKKNVGLQVAKAGKKDDFYTQLTDIEKELKYYKELLKDKIVFCNCDDPEESNFWKYFKLNFHHLGLKRLISTHYQEEGSSYSLEYDGENIIKTDLKENGDFRSEECLEILKRSDIVITNPPFSLFRDFVSQLIMNNKKFLIIGNMNSVTYKDFFPLVREGKIWLGPSIKSGDREFRVPEDYPLTAAGCRVDEEGNKYIRVKGVRWYTNLDYKERYEDLILYEKYSEEKYPKYDNYNAINVNKVKEIPIDYDGLIGVPITFMDKFNPNQFEILGIDRYIEDNPIYGKRFTINEKEIYARIIIKHKRSENREDRA